MEQKTKKFLFLKKEIGLYTSILVITAVLAGFLFLLSTEIGKAQESLEEFENFSQFSIIEENSLLPIANAFEPQNAKVTQEFQVIVTGYSSTPWETWGNPFVTASGSWVEDGIIANNLLPFGTKVRFPELYGNKIFVVKDRMHSRKQDNHMDIWFPSNQKALNFGVERTYVEVIEEVEA